MSTTSSRRAYHDSSRGQWASGIELFAGLMLALVAMVQILNGIAAIAEDTLFLTGYDYVFAFDLTTWGWVSLVLGLLAGATAVGVVLRTTWGRMAGVLVAFVGALASFGFMPYQPWWGVVVLAFNSLVIWALLTQTYYLGD
ncbi:DUF7144 family membrane protein [Nocardioides lianchengensis]|uniref:DUF7144 domain-containing protein n=1 Tax=Nocardioides lianchengensis TaxID=1045774 RepID=A0A1G6YVT4_9ACTN|nr:hypothetical protein [Nocardioides lianchengensis]NYG09515.1 hypothetical protein [Nocardioides lianchengensis]SDD94382.1 hypothetical protein SAMN05421872_112178 [Nocardioides lianchengensis]